MEIPTVYVGDLVIYTEPDGTDRNALVTAVWSPQCINVVYVNGDENQKDQYGRQIKRSTSVLYAGVTGTAHGQIWRLPIEPKPEYKPPINS